MRLEPVGATNLAMARLSQPNLANFADVARLVQKKLDQLTQKGYPAIQLSISSPSGNIVASSGLSNIQSSRKVSDDSKFVIGSVTKIFTSVMILQLVEEGRLSLDDTVSKLLPELASGIEKSETITVADLLKHTSGIPDYRGHGATIVQLLNEDNTGWTMEDSVRAVAGEANQLSEEAKPLYSNTNYNLLGLILQKFDEKPFEQILQDRITTRLNMRDTQIGYPLSDSQFVSGYSNLSCIPEAFREGGFKSNIGPQSGELFDSTKVDALFHLKADGGIVSTVNDMKKFTDALFRSNKLLAPRSRNLLDSDTVALDENTSMGYGCAVQNDDKDGKKIFLYGSTLGYQGFMIYYPKYDLTINALTNREPISPTSLLGQDLLSELFAEDQIKSFFMGS